MQQARPFKVGDHVFVGNPREAHFGMIVKIRDDGTGRCLFDVKLYGEADAGLFVTRREEMRLEQ